MTDLLAFMHDRALTPAERRRLKGRSTTKPNGYAAMPGTGPTDQTCGSCAHLYRNRLAKTYLKCALMAKFWTGGAGTDVLARSPACRNWSAQTEEGGAA